MTMAVLGCIGWTAADITARLTAAALKMPYQCEIDPDVKIEPINVMGATAINCYQKSAGGAGADAIAAAYRDRTVDEIRDTSIVRLTDHDWTQPVAIYEDG
ncbi:hypothetical protein [Sulfitobacter sp. BSw21498]|uniref:hypothetical protein n=1 Tax=Sulfitobacter sp. BSw21498 TaxID=664426 RepID=UPI0011103265|nr:hypothetical protein [Sulfitobacter sp. BSw21498]